MGKPNEVNNETIAKAAYYCAEELHHALSSLNMPPYPLDKDGDPDVDTDKFMPELFHYVRHARDHLFQARTFANYAEHNMVAMRTEIARALMRLDRTGDQAAFRLAIESLLK